MEKSEVTFEDAPRHLTRQQKIRWTYVQNKTGAFAMWRCRMKKIGQPIDEQTYIISGYDYIEDVQDGE